MMPPRPGRWRPERESRLPRPRRRGTHGADRRRPPRRARCAPPPTAAPTARIRAALARIEVEVRAPVAAEGSGGHLRHAQVDPEPQNPAYRAAKTKAGAIYRLDELGVPWQGGRRLASRALREADGSALSNARMAEVVRWRKARL